MFDLATKYSFILHKDSKRNLELSLMLYTLEKYVNGAIIEMNRLERTRRNIHRKLSNLNRDINTPYVKDYYLTYLTCDTHFYFICIDKCYKLIAQLSQELNDKDIEELKMKIDKIFDITAIRNHLEHIEDRSRGFLNLKDKEKNIKKHISDFGNFVGDHFSFHNQKFPSGKKSLEQLKNIYVDLLKILDNRARRDPEFIKQIERDEQINLIRKALKKAGQI